MHNIELPKNIRPLIIFNMLTSWTISPSCSCNWGWKELTIVCKAIALFSTKETAANSLPNPRSTRNSFFSSDVPGGPSKKFSGFTSPCTYLSWTSGTKPLQCIYNNNGRLSHYSQYLFMPISSDTILLYSYMQLIIPNVTLLHSAHKYSNKFQNTSITWK